MQDTVAQLQNPEHRQTFESLRAGLGADREYLWTDPGLNRDEMVAAIADAGATVVPATIDGADLRAYLQRAEATGIYRDYAKHFGSYFRRKALEHYVSFRLLDVASDDIYMDVASSGSVVPEILESLYGLREVWRQDIAYKNGVNGNRVGSNADDIPLPNASVTKMGLHCSFEHFEGNADTGFVREAARLLKPGGAVCILPLYVSNRYHILSSLELIAKLRAPDFESNAPIFFSTRPNNYHGRFYDVRQLIERVLNPAHDAGLATEIVDLRISDSEVQMGTNLALLLRRKASS